MMTHPSSPPGRHTWDSDSWTGRNIPQQRQPGWWDEQPGATPAQQPPPAQHRDPWQQPQQQPPQQPVRQPQQNTAPDPYAGWTPPQPGWQAAEPQQWYANEPDPQEEAWADLRNQAADRIRRMNGSHCLNAFDRLGSRDAIGPHGIALFYAEPIAGSARVHLRTATRLFLDGDDAEHLPSLLSALARAAATNTDKASKAGRTWDPRDPATGMVNRAEEMSDRSLYVGVGVSTLDMPDMDWNRAAMAADTALDLPGRGFVLLNDGTAMLIERRAHRAFAEHGVWSNKSLDIRPGQQTRLWSRAPRLLVDADEQSAQIWQGLQALHETLHATRESGHRS